MLSDKRVLTIDDSATTRLLLRSLLRAQGAHVDAAQDGREGLALCAANLYDLILLDLALPDMNGIEVLQTIRATNEISTVVMLTGSGGIKFATSAVRHGADGYLEKQELADGDLTEFLYALEQALEYRARAVENATLRRQLDEQHRQLEAELARAAQVQAELLPHHVPTLSGFELAARMVPAREVGGDFYNWRQPTPDIFTLQMCDVMGKGMPAAIMMATVRAAMRSVVHNNPPAEAMRSAASALEGDFERTGGFATVFLARLDLTTRRLTYVDAGHGHDFLLRSDGTVEALQPRGLPLGVLPEEEYQEGALTFGMGDALVLYSDGLIDARPDLALDAHALAREISGATTATEMAQRLVNLAAGKTPLPDDLTVLILRCVEE